MDNISEDEVKKREDVPAISAFTPDVTYRLPGEPTANEEDRWQTHWRGDDPNGLSTGSC